jgi:hypothetical protein
MFHCNFHPSFATETPCCCYLQLSHAVRFSCWTHSWCFHSLLLSPSWLFSFPPLNNMLKFSGWSWWRDGLKIVALFEMELKLALCPLRILSFNNVQAAFLFSQVILLLKEPSSPYSFLPSFPLSPSYSPSFHFWRCWLKQYVLAFKYYNWCLTLTYFSSLFIYYYVLHRKRIQDIHDWHSMLYWRCFFKLVWNSEILCVEVKSLSHELTKDPLH